MTFIRRVCVSLAVALVEAFVFLFPPLVRVEDRYGVRVVEPVGVVPGRSGDRRKSFFRNDGKRHPSFRDRKVVD